MIVSPCAAIAHEEQHAEVLSPVHALHGSGDLDARVALAQVAHEELEGLRDEEPHRFDRVGAFDDIESEALESPRTMSLADVSTDTSTRKGQPSVRRMIPDRTPRVSQPAAAPLAFRSIDGLERQTVRLGDGLVGHVTLGDVEALLERRVLPDRPLPALVRERAARSGASRCSEAKVDVRATAPGMLATA